MERGKRRLNMIIDDPYYIEINDKEKAAYTILNMCNNCYRLHYCTGAEALKCNQIKERLGNKNGKEKFY